MTKLAGMAALPLLLGIALSSPFPSRSQGTQASPLQQTVSQATISLSDPALVRDLLVTAGKSVLIESTIAIERVSVGFGDVAEATAVAPTEVLVDGKTPGQTSMIIWQRGGGKMFFNLTVAPNGLATANRVEAVSRELKRELPEQEVEISYENDTVFLRGRVKDLVSADRAVSIASTLGRTVNLLYVDVPAVEPEILLRVRFATVDRSASLQLGLNIVSTGAGKTVGGISTQQFSSPQITNGASGPAVSLSDALNVFLFRSDLNLMAAIQALQENSLMEILAEPNVLAMNGKPASFLAGGEFPFPAFQPVVGGAGTITVQFREYGVRLNFTPTITPRGTISLLVAPEVSALDFTSGLTVQGFTIPALTVRKVSTEIELAAGQSFAIGGLIDNQLTETIARIPVLGDIPVLGKLFQSKSRLRNNTELIVIVTPELVVPLKSDQQVPDMKFPQSPVWPRVAPKDETLPIPQQTPAAEAIPFETLIKSMKSLESETLRNTKPALAIPQMSGTPPPPPRVPPPD